MVNGLIKARSLPELHNHKLPRNVSISLDSFYIFYISTPKEKKKKKTI